MDGREQEEELSTHSHMPSTPSSISIFDTHEQGTLWHSKNDKFVYDASLSSNNSYSVKNGDNISVKALCLDTQLENISNDELEVDSCSTNVQGQEEHITNDMFVDDACFCEWLDISRTNELASKYNELEEKDTFEFLPATKEKYYEVFSVIVRLRKSIMNYILMMPTKVKHLNLYVSL
jgi:hypothetical protein